MSRVVLIIWLCMAWLIAVLGGFSMHYSFEADLSALGVLSGLMTVGALAASLVPLSRGFELWDRSGTASSAPSKDAPPRIPIVKTIVHEAGTPAAAVQRCARCSVVLIDPTRDRTIGGTPARPVPAGTWIEEREDIFYPGPAPRKLGPGESLCAQRAQKLPWQLAGGE
ncbi:MAG: hypothetical protein ACR2L3_01775 [Actinomycetota bacterium]